MFPVFLDLRNKQCLIVGGGRVALRKARVLLDFAPHLTIIAPEFCEDMLNTSELQPYCHKREYQPQDLIGVDLVIAATDNQELNQQIVTDCNQKRILVNSATSCISGETVAFPSVIKRGLVTIGINSGGNPSLSKNLRQRIEAVLPDDLGDKSYVSKRFREEQKQTITGKVLKAKMTDHINKIID